MFKRLNEASGGIVRLVTVAPEEPGAIEFIREVSRLATVSIGHTTADYDTAMAAYEAGATHATHLFNGMPSLLHRDRGHRRRQRCRGHRGADHRRAAHPPLGHPAHPPAVRGTAGADLRLLRCAGMPDGDYTLGGQPITMKNGKATLTGTDTLVGSAIHLMDGLRRAVSFGGPLESGHPPPWPPRPIRQDGEIGSIEPGKCADLVVLDSDLNLKAVFIDGKPGRSDALPALPPVIQRVFSPNSCARSPIIPRPSFCHPAPFPDVICAYHLSSSAHHLSS